MNHNLKLRSLSGIFIILATIFICFAPTWCTFLALNCIGYFCIYELNKILKYDHYWIFALSLLPLIIYVVEVPIYLITACTILIPFLVLSNIWVSSYVFLITFAIQFAVLLQVKSPLILFAVFLLTWAHDVGGYMFGKWLQGPKIASKISPNKTWSGFFGGILLGYILWLPLQQLIPFWMIPLANIVGLIGDFTESKIKRLHYVKDSGTLIPGHGGFLDRFDSFFAITTLFYLWINWKGFL